jgi:plasmid replication initiation protein
MEYNNLVVKSNSLTLSVYHKDINVLGRDIIELAIARLKTTDTGLEPIRIPVGEVVGNDDGRTYAQVKQALTQVSTFGIVCDNPVSWSAHAVFTSAYLIHNSGLIFLKFNPDLRDELLSLKENFTEYALGMYLDLRSKYAKDLYEKLSVWLNTKAQFTYNLKTLHKHLNSPKYARLSFVDFRRNILDPAIAEINEKTDWDLSYSTKKMRLYDKKAGKSVTKTADIIFHKRTKKNTAVVAAE